MRWMVSLLVENQMRKLITTTILLVLAGIPAAVAQTGSSAGSSAGPTSSAVSSTTGGAPVGHRQPRLSDVPSEKNLSNPDDQTNRENAALDRKIKSICRGC